MRECDEHVYNNTSYILLVNYILRRKDFGKQHTFKQTLVPVQHKHIA